MPKHVALRPVDAQPLTTCTGGGWSSRTCTSGTCPTHAPSAYADCMARHSANYPGENYGASFGVDYL